MEESDCVPAKMEGRSYCDWLTRKLIYRKDDRAMRHIYVCARKKFERPWVRPRLLLRKFLMGFCCHQSYEWAYKNLKFVALPTPAIIAIAVFGWGCEPPILGKGRPYMSGLVPFERALVCSCRASNLHGNFSSIFTRFRDIAAYVLQHATFPTHL